MSHAAYISLSYGIAGVLIALALVRIALDHRALKRALEKIGAPVDERGETP